MGVGKLALFGLLLAPLCAWCWSVAINIAIIAEPYRSWFDYVSTIGYLDACLLVLATMAAGVTVFLFSSLPKRWQRRPLRFAYMYCPSVAAGSIAFALPVSLRIVSDAAWAFDAGNPSWRPSESAASVLRLLGSDMVGLAVAAAVFAWMLICYAPKRWLHLSQLCDCGYPTTGIRGDTCPECGQAIRPSGDSR